MKKTEAQYQKRRKIYGMISIAAFLGLSVFLTFAIGKPLVALAKNPDQFRAFIDSYGVWGRLIFIGIQVVQVIVALIPGEVVEVGSGYAFGPIEGLLLCMAGLAIASAIIFLLVKKLGVRLVEIFISREKITEMKILRGKGRLDAIVFLVYFIPGIPKDLFTYFAGLTPMTLRRFLAISLTARIPSILTSTLGGSALLTKNYSLAIAIFAITGVLSVCGVVIYNQIVKKRRAKHGNVEKELRRSGG